VTTEARTAAGPPGWGGRLFCLLSIAWGLVSLPTPGVAQQSWEDIVQRGGYTGTSQTVRNVFASAASSAPDGRVALQVRGTPDELLVAAVATAFAPTDRRFPTNSTIDRIAFQTCGHISPEYRSRILLANPGKFVNGVLSGLKGTFVSLKMPACLAANDYVKYNVLPGNTISFLAESVSKRPADQAYCSELAKVNEFDVCKASQTGALKPDTRIWLPRPKEVRTWSTVARLNTETGGDGQEALAGWITDSVQRPSPPNPIGANAQDLTIVPTKPDETPRGVVPLADCNTSFVPFDTDRLVEVLTRLSKAVQEGRVNPVDPVRVGIIDTGLYDKARESFFERIPVVAGPWYRREDGRYLRNIVTKDNLGTWARSYTGDRSSVAPDSGSFADHGTHVAGLIVGGGDFWTALRSRKFPEPQMPEYIGTYVPEIVPVKIMSSGKSDPDTLGLAVDYLTNNNRTSVINLSTVVRANVTVKETFEKYRRSGVIFVAAAGNDYDQEFDNSLDKEDVANPILPAMMSSGDGTYFITVGALDSADFVADMKSKGKPAKFSQRGRKYVDLFAPGICVRSFGEQNPLTEDVAYSGTSQAAPIVSFAAALLLRFGVRGESVKTRLLETVDASADLARISISGGSLNISKALDYLDDIVVFSDTPRGEYRRGTIVHTNGDAVLPDGFLTSLCSADADPVDQGLRKVRRAVVLDESTMKWVSGTDAGFKYETCTYKKDLTFRLKATDGQPDRNFVLKEVREMVPRPKWAPLPKVR
jgi:subtilisin family serine protease